MSELDRLQSLATQRRGSTRPPADDENEFSRLQRLAQERRAVQQPAAVAEPLAPAEAPVGTAPPMAPEPAVAPQLPVPGDSDVAIAQQVFNEPEAPSAPPAEAFEPVARGVDRFLGRDVSDPQETARLVSQVVGGLGGGVLGARVPVRNIAVNPITGSIVGGTLGVLGGTAAPEAAVNALEKVGLLPPGTAESTTLSMEELQTVLEGELVLEAALTGTIGAARLMGRGVARWASGLTDEGQDIAERSAALGIDLMPVQVGDRSLGRGFVSVMGKFPLIGAPFKRHGADAEREFARVMDEAPERIAPLVAASDIGRKIYADAEGLLRHVNADFSARYDDLWRQAEQAGVMVHPRYTMHKADEIIAQLRADAPQTAAQRARGEAGDLMPDSVAASTAEFLENAVLRLRGVTDGGARVTPAMTLKQLDTLDSAMSEMMTRLEPGQQKYARSLVAQMKQAIAMDATTNARGPGAQEIVEARRALDAEFSQTMAQVFETATANRFGSVRRRGLRAREFDTTTRTPVDKLTRIVMDADSPQMIDELARLVQPETMRQIAGSYLDDAIQKAMRQAPDGTFSFSSEAFERALGLGRRDTPRRQVTERLLHQTGGMTPDDLNTLVDVSRSLAGMQIPDMSQFVARRGVMGGREAVMGAFLAGGSAGATSRHGVASTLGSTLLFLGGARGLAAVLANPDSARALLNVAESEASRGVTRATAMRAIRASIGVMRDDGVDVPDNETAYQLGRQFFLGAERSVGENVEPPSDREIDRAYQASQTRERPTSRRTRREDNRTALPR